MMSRYVTFFCVCSSVKPSEGFNTYTFTPVSAAMAFANLGLTNSSLKIAFTLCYLMKATISAMRSGVGSASGDTPIIPNCSKPYAFAK